MSGPSCVWSLRRGFSTLRRIVAWACVSGFIACTHFPEGSATPGARPPPKPGSSISHTQMCRCIACLDPACCTREAEGEQTESCREVDGQIQCGLKMKSCGRCQEVVWRISLSESCAASQPKDCCKKVAARR